jgi:hypothetical protein
MWIPENVYRDDSSRCFLSITSGLLFVSNSPLKAGEKLTVIFISAFFKLTPLHPPLSPREGGKWCPATSYPLSIIERGTRGELRKAKKPCQLWSFSPGF